MKERIKEEKCERINERIKEEECERIDKGRGV